MILLELLLSATLAAAVLIVVILLLFVMLWPFYFLASLVGLVKPRKRRR